MFCKCVILSLMSVCSGRSNLSVLEMASYLKFGRMTTLQVNPDDADVDFLGQLEGQGCISTRC